ncbi:MAG: hypothetical protein LC713_00990 [Actinobacteria bacterium]|nr:hypothetical protein [Actinomycetota bacterium]
MAAIDVDLAQWFDRAPFAEAVRRLGAYRDVTALGALTLGHRGLGLAAVPHGGECSWAAAWSPASIPAASARPGAAFTYAGKHPPAYRSLDARVWA